MSFKAETVNLTTLQTRGYGTQKLVEERFCVEAATNVDVLLNKAHRDRAPSQKV